VKASTFPVIHADEGKILVISDNTELNNKISKFIIESGLKKLAKNPTTKPERK
jgi:hypothetical protein